MTSMEERIREALTGHSDNGGYNYDAERSMCQCGATLWNNDWRDHAASVVAGLLRAAQAEAFEQGQKSGIRHADRVIAAAKMGRPELPGPPSANPYRTEGEGATE